MKLLIKNGLVMTHDHKENQIDYLSKDILINEDIIERIDDYGEIIEEDAEIIDASNCVVTPGFVNSHMHSHDNLNKGYLDNKPLELWMLQIRPILSSVHYSEEEIFLRTIYGAIEMIKNGTTTVIDDVLLNHLTDEKTLSVIIDAYREIGMRAIVCPHTKNIPMIDTIPRLREKLKDDLVEKLELTSVDEEDILRFLEKQIDKYNTESALVKVGLAPSAPHRCTLPLLEGIKSLSIKYQVPAIMHVLETRIQKATGDLFYNRSLIKYLDDNNLLYSNLVSVHSIWVTDEDINLLKEKACKSIHNPSCNMKMGSGIAPVSKLSNHLIPVGLGTDNTSANDSVNMFEAMKNAALLSKIRSPELNEWMTSEEVLKMATIDGAKCALMADKIGVLQEGFKADLSIIELLNEHHAASINLSNTLVYAENGSSVRDVLINGQFAMKNKKICHIDEKKIFMKIKQLRQLTSYTKKVAEIESVEIYDAIRAIYKDLL